MPETIYSKAGADAATAAAIAAQELGTAAITDASDYATAEQGAKADSAVQPDVLGDAAAKDIGTTAGTVKAGDWKPLANDITDASSYGRALIRAAEPKDQRIALGLYPGSNTRTKVLIIGSSNVGGALADPVESMCWVGLLQTRLAATHDIVKMGVGGRNPEWWITPNAVGMTELDSLILIHKPHIVVASFATQNETAQAPTAITIANIERARAICEAQGVRFIGATPYASNSYTAAQIDVLKWVAEELAVRDIPVLDFGGVWGDPPIPAAIDSGDGLHLNNAGHAEQAARVPTDWLSTHAKLAPIRFPSVAAGLGTTVPAAGVSTATTDPGFLTVAPFPSGSWTVAVSVKYPAVPRVSVPLWSFGVGAIRMRLRVPNADQLDIQQCTIPVQAIPSGTAATYHIAVSYDDVRNAMKMYIDGVLVGTGQAAASTYDYTEGLTLGSTAAGVVGAANGYTFRDLTIHATALSAANVRRLATGHVPLVSLWMAAGLRDGVARPAGAMLATIFGQQSIPTVNYALT